MDTSEQHYLQTDSPSQRQHFGAGVQDSLPVVLGYLVIGFAFGVVARTSGLTVLEITLMSLILYAGSAQFVVVGLIAGGASAASIIVTILLVNLRHLLYSAALAPHLSRLPSWQNALIGTELTDETFAVAASRLAPGEHAQAAWLFGLNLTSQTAWVTGSILGALLGHVLTNTQALGLDFALVAMFAALLVFQIKSRPQLGVAVSVALIGGVVGLGGTWIMSPSWAIIVAAVSAASAGVVIERWCK